MKGQVFIVVSIFVAITLLAIAMMSHDIQESEDYLQNYFVNLRTELNEITSEALLEGEDPLPAINDYVLFSDQILSSKGYDQQISASVEPESIVIDIYLGKGTEYYMDTLVVYSGVYT